jgi:hypothetical protein
MPVIGRALKSPQQPTTACPFSHGLPWLLAIAAVVTTCMSAFGQLTLPPASKPLPTPAATPAPSPDPAPVAPTHSPADAPKADGPRQAVDLLPQIAASAPLTTDEVRIETAGVILLAPENCAVIQPQSLAAVNGVELLPDHGRFVIRITTQRTTPEISSIAQVREGLIKQIEQASAVVDSATGQTTPRSELLQFVPTLTIPGSKAPGERLYMRMPGAAGTDPTNKPVTGYSIFKPQEGMFVVFELITTQQHLTPARGVFEVVVATAKFEDPRSAQQQRAGSLSAGAKLIASLSEQDLRALADGQERWYRLYAPASSSSSELEHGYRRITASWGRKSDLGGTVSSSQDLPGLIVKSEVRMVNYTQPGQVGSTIDTSTSAYVSADRSMEAWTTTTAVREDEPVERKAGNISNRRASKPSAVFREIGSRQGDNLTILVTGTGRPDQQLQPAVQDGGKHYLSQAESMMLGGLLAQKAGNSKGTEFGFYAYRPETGSISLRREIVRASASGQSVEITSRLREDLNRTVSQYDPSGIMARSELPDGRVWELSDQATIMGKWKR